MLLAKLWVAQTIEIDNRFEAENAAALNGRFHISMPMWANGLRLVDEAGTPFEDVRRQARADCNIGGLERWGWITVGEPTGGRGVRRDGYGTGRGLRAGSILRPTRAGTTARRQWPVAVESVEDRWVERFGAEVVKALRSELSGLVPAMPWAVPQVSASDGFRTTVVESDGDPDAGELPLVVLLGQALTALTVRSESGSLVSRPLGENLLRTLEGAAVAVRDLPAVTGLSKEAVAMVVNFAVRRELVALDSGRMLTLTARGQTALADHLARGVETDQPLLRSLETIMSQPRKLAAGLDPPPGVWRGEQPYLAQTRRWLEDPVRALPRHPMVLHRGGWPDGS